MKVQVEITYTYDRINNILGKVFIRERFIDLLFWVLPCKNIL